MALPSEGARLRGAPESARAQRRRWECVPVPSWAPAAGHRGGQLPSSVAAPHIGLGDLHAPTAKRGDGGCHVSVAVRRGWGTPGGTAAQAPRCVPHAPPRGRAGPAAAAAHAPRTPEGRETSPDTRSPDPVTVSPTSRDRRRRLAPRRFPCRPPPSRGLTPTARLSPAGRSRRRRQGPPPRPYDTATIGASLACAPPPALPPEERRRHGGGPGRADGRRPSPMVRGSESAPPLTGPNRRRERWAGRGRWGLPAGPGRRRGGRASADRSSPRRLASGQVRGAPEAWPAASEAPRLGARCAEARVAGLRSPGAEGTWGLGAGADARGGGGHVGGEGFRDPGGLGGSRGPSDSGRCSARADQASALREARALGREVPGLAAGPSPHSTALLGGSPRFPEGLSFCFVGGTLPFNGSVSDRSSVLGPGLVSCLLCDRRPHPAKCLHPSGP